MNIYFKQSQNPTTCHIRIFVPLDVFNCQNDFDITALHLTEHCCFGSRKELEHQNKLAYRFGGFTPEGKLTKISVEFSYSFFTSNFNHAIDWFIEFVNRFSKNLTKNHLRFHQKELIQELTDLDDDYKKFSILRKKIFLNKPFSLSSGGQMSLVTKIEPEIVNQYKQIIAKEGVFLLSIPDNFILPKIQGVRFLEVGNIPHRSPLKSVIKQKLYQDKNSLAFVLPKISQEENFILYSSINYLKNELDLFGKIKHQVSSYPDLGMLSFVGKNASDTVKSIYALREQTHNRAVQYASEHLTETIYLDPEEMIILEGRNWIIGQASCSADKVSDILKNCFCQC